MTTATVELADLETIIFATGVIKTIERAALGMCCGLGPMGLLVSASQAGAKR